MALFDKYIDMADFSSTDSSEHVVDRSSTPPAGRIFYLGLAIYALSFFLPAIRADYGLQWGWRCALTAPFAFSWIGATEIGLKTVALLLSTFGGLINPIAIAYVILRLSRQATTVRRALAVIVVIGIPLTWIALYLMEMSPYVGYACWIAGLVLIIFDDVRNSLLRSAK